MLRMFSAFVVSLLPAFGLGGVALAHPEGRGEPPAEQEGGPLVSPDPGGQAVDDGACDRHHHGRGPARGRGHAHGRGRGHHADQGEPGRGPPPHAEGHRGQRGPPPHARGQGRGRR